MKNGFLNKLYSSVWDQYAIEHDKRNDHVIVIDCIGNKYCYKPGSTYLHNSTGAAVEECDGIIKEYWLHGNYYDNIEKWEKACKTDLIQNIII